MAEDNTPTNVVDDLKNINKSVEEFFKSYNDSNRKHSHSDLADYLLQKHNYSIVESYIESFVEEQGKINPEFNEISFNEFKKFKNNINLDINVSNDSYLKNYFDTPTNVVDDVPTLNTDLVWENDALERRNIGDKNPSWADNVIPQNNILKPNLKFEDLRKIVPQIIDGTVSDVDFTRFGIWLMSKSPEIAFGTKSFSSPDALADITKIVIFNGKNPSDLINENTLEIIKNEIGYKEGSRAIDYVPPDNKLSKAFDLEPRKSLIGLSDELILQFGKEEGPFANAQQRMKQTIINEHNKLYANAEDYFILFRGGELTDDPIQSFSKSGERSYNIALHFDKNLTDKGVDAYYVNKNDFIDLHSLGLDYDNEKELIVYKEAVENPYSKTVMKEGQTVNFLDEGRVKFIQDNWITISDEFPKKGFISTDTPGGSLGAAKLNDPLVFDSWVDNYANTTTSFVDNLPLVKPVKDMFLNAADNRIKRLARQVATPGGILDAVDIWEIGVLALVAGAIAYNEIDEIPKIGYNAILRTYNLSQGRPIDAPLRIIGLPTLEISEYDIDFEYAMETLERGEKIMPTDIIIKELAESSLEKGEPAVLPGTGVTATTGIDEEFAPYKESIIKEREETARIKRDEVKQKILESKGVQEEKMFEQAKPKKSKPTGGAGAKIL